MKEVGPSAGHAMSGAVVAFSPGGVRLASASADGIVKLWDTQTGAEVVTLRGRSGDVTALAFSPDGHFLVGAANDGTIQAWDGRPAGE